MSLQDLIAANQHTLKGVQQVLIELSDAAYTEVVAPFSASLGKHMRHIMDHYQQLLLGMDNLRVDYDARQRNELAENSRTEMIKLIESVRSQLAELSHRNDVQMSVVLSIDETASTPEVSSTLSRELVFLQSHTTHHCAIISAMLNLQGQSIPEGFGIAASTLKYEHQQCAH